MTPFRRFLSHATIRGIAGHKRRTVAVFRRTYPEMLLRLPKRLQTNDGFYVLGDIGRHTRSILGRSISEASLRDAHHIDSKTLLDLVDTGFSVDAGVVCGDLSDFESLALKPRNQILGVGSDRGIFLA